MNHTFADFICYGIIICDVYSFKKHKFKIHISTLIFRWNWEVREWILKNLPHAVSKLWQYRHQTPRYHASECLSESKESTIDVIMLWWRNPWRKNVYDVKAERISDSTVENIQKSRIFMLQKSVRCISSSRWCFCVFVFHQSRFSFRLEVCYAKDSQYA